MTQKEFLHLRKLDEKYKIGSFELEPQDAREMLEKFMWLINNTEIVEQTDEEWILQLYYKI